MLFGQLTLGVHHLGLYPDAELHASFVGGLHQCRHAVGQFLTCGLPVAQACLVVAAGILVAEPSVVEQEQIDTQRLGFAEEVGKFLLIEVEICVLPVVEQRHAVLGAHVELVVQGPALETSASLAYALGGEGKIEVGRAEHLATRQEIARGVGVYTRDDAQCTVVVHLEGEAEVARPSKCSHEHASLLLAGGAVQSDFEEGLCKHRGTGAEAGVDDLLAILELLAAHLHLACPVAGKLGEVIGSFLKVEHRRIVAAQVNLPFLVVLDFAPLAYDVLVGVCRIVEGDAEGIYVVAQLDDGLGEALTRLLLVADILEYRGRVAVGVGNLECLFEEVLRAHHGVCLEASRQRVGAAQAGHIEDGEVIDTFDTLAQIGLVETSVILHLQHQLYVAGLNGNLVLAIGACRNEQHGGQECSSHSLSV